MNSRTRPAYTASEFSEITGLSVEETVRWGGRAARNPERRVFSWRDALETIAVLIHEGGEERVAEEAGCVPPWLVRAPAGTLACRAANTLGPLANREAEEVLRKGGMAWRDLNGRIRHISIDPDRLSGIPEIAGTRVHAIFVGLEAQRPGGRQVLTRSYDLTLEQIEDAILWS